MANPVYVKFTLPATTTSNIATNHTFGSAGNLTLDGATVTAGVATAPSASGVPVARRIDITSGASDTGITFTITGTDRYGNPQSEVLTGGATVATSLLDYKTVSQIANSGATNVTSLVVGFSATGSTKWFPMDHFRASFNIGIGMRLVSGTSTASAEYTLEPYDKTIFELDPANAVGSWVAPLAIACANSTPSLSAKSATADGALIEPVRAVRLTVTAGTGLWNFSVIQTGVTP